MGRDQASPSSPLALEATGLCKRYGESIALADVDLALQPGRVVGLVGENGAGKSTLLNILSGITAPDAGALRIDGVPRPISSYGDAQRLGVGRVFQEQALVPNVPVFENLLLGHERTFAAFGQFVRRRRMIEAAQAMVERAGAKIDVRRQTADLSFSERQLVEIVRASLGPSFLFGIESPVVLLDEPTASLEKGDEILFFALIEAIRRHSAILFVSHRLGEVIRLSDEIVVLKDGRRVGALKPDEASEQALHRLMVGRERDADYYHETAQRDDLGEPILAARNLSRMGHYQDVSLAVRSGEILGIGGLLDSGKSALGKALVGIEPPESGEVRLASGAWSRPEIGSFIRRGVGYVPAERILEGMIVSQPVAWNVSLASGADLFSNRIGVWRQTREQTVTRDLMARLRIKARSPLDACARLSGGNQQKVVLARWLVREDLRVLVLDNPTRGVDAGAKEEIYGLLRSLTDRGIAIILITDELLELIGLSNRIAIMRQGRLLTTIPADIQSKPTEEEVVALMLANVPSPGTVSEAA